MPDLRPEDQADRPEAGPPRRTGDLASRWECVSCGAEYHGLVGEPTMVPEYRSARCTNTGCASRRLKKGLGKSTMRRIP